MNLRFKNQTQIHKENLRLKRLIGDSKNESEIQRMNLRFKFESQIQKTNLKLESRSQTDLGFDGGSLLALAPMQIPAAVLPGAL